MTVHKAALDIFEEAGMDKLFKKGKSLAGYLHYVLTSINNGHLIDVITPANENERGCQLSMLMLERGKEIFQTLQDQGVVADWREPNVMRMAPVPLYNSFEDIYRFKEALFNK